MVEFKPGTYGHIAQKDLDGAIRTAAIFPSGSGVYAQQAVEKMLKQYLKEVLYCSDENLLRTHNLRRLFKAVGISGLDQYKAQLYELSDAYFNTRYPGEDYWVLTATEAEELCAVATVILSIVETEIEKFRA